MVDATCVVADVLSCNTLYPLCLVAAEKQTQLSLWVACILQVLELPSAQMYAKLHAQQQQQHPGSRAHVVSQRPEQVDQQEDQNNTDDRS